MLPRLATAGSEGPCSRGSVGGHALGCVGLCHTGSLGCATAQGGAGGSAGGNVPCEAGRLQPVVVVGDAALGLLDCSLSDAQRVRLMVL